MYVVEPGHAMELVSARVQRAHDLWCGLDALLPEPLVLLVVCRHTVPRLSLRVGMRIAGLLVPGPSRPLHGDHSRPMLSCDKWDT